jgi:hypothetical protein
MEHRRRPPRAGLSSSASEDAAKFPGRPCVCIGPGVAPAQHKTKGFTTKCVRDQASSKKQKEQTYVWYDIEKPKNNSGKTQTCELDHIISLQLGGADTLENLWPQCGRANVALPKRSFKRKDDVENYLARQIKDGKIGLKEAQQGIAEDWTQFLDDALAVKLGKKK